MPTLRWQPITTLLLSIAGLGVSIYLTITHFDKARPGLLSNGTINCEKVTTSPQSVRSSASRWPCSAWSSSSP